jgi:hypothetical protein
MYENAKIIPIETIPGMADCKNFCKCQNVPPLNTTIKKKEMVKHLRSDS